MPRPDSKKGSSPRRGVFRKVVLALWFVGVACVGLAGGIAWALFHALGGAGTVGTVVESMRHPGERAFGARDALYVLCLGIDYNHDSKGILYTKYARSDSVFVVRIDKQANTLSVVSIPRDMRVEIPGHGHDKINTAYSYKANGDLDLARKTVEQFLGVHIDHTVVIKPYAVEHVVDAFGGVDLDVERDMDYDDNWGNLHIHLKKGLQHLSGQQAVGYIRFRKDAEGKFVWPGYGENMRVLKWMIDRIEGQGQGSEGVMGITPRYEDLNWTGLNFTAGDFNQVTSIDKAAWQAELKLHEELFTQLAYHLPAELTATKAKIEQRLAA